MSDRLKNSIANSKGFGNEGGIHETSITVTFGYINNFLMAMEQ